MAAFTPPSRMILIPAIGGVAAGGLVAVAVTLLPVGGLQGIVSTTGITALVPAAAPPLGMTARFLVALGSGFVAATIAWACLYLVFGPGGVVDARRKRARGVPVVRRADAHPDAPPRHPMSAADLGTPLMEVVAAPGEQPLPKDLDQPLAAFDPHAVLASPREPVRPVAPLAAPPVAPSAAQSLSRPEPALARQVDRIETFEITPIVRPSAPPPPDAPPSIETLLSRLEQGARRRRQVHAG